jgi:uncharacterized protein (TIGR00297 family)
VTLLGFFLLGSLVSKLGYRTKEALGVAQEKGGARSARHALANVGVAAVAAALGVWTHQLLLTRVALAGALAAAAADTVATEAGQVWGRRPFLPTTLKGVRPGTPGAISVPGTLAGAGAAAYVSLVAWRSGLVLPSAVAAVVVGGVAGTLFESYLHVLLGGRRVSHEFVNFLNTLAGAGAAALLAQLSS